MANPLLERIAVQVLEQALGYGVGGAIEPAIAPFIADLTQEFWSLNPVLVESPEELAAMVVQGVLDQADAAGEAQKSGINADRFDHLVRVNGSPIAPEQALDLWNRGEISEDDVSRALRQSRLKPEWVDTFKLLRRQILQLADLANMVVQGILTQDVARGRAAQLGIDGADFDLLVRLAGNPPGPETVLDMWNRGIVTEDEATRALLQSRLKPEWIEQFKQTRTNPPTLSASVNAVLKERIPMARGIELARQVGVDEATFRMLVDEAGRPIATGEALTLVRRGQMTPARFREVIARSDVKTEYTDDILNLQTVYPSLYQIKQILATGAITDETAKGILNKEGYTDDVIAGIIAAAHGVKLAKQKDLSQTAIVELYQAREIDARTATDLLNGLGFDDNDVALLLGLADYNAARAFRNAVISTVRARYLQGDIDEATASQQLDQVGVAPAARDEYLQLWTFDREANPRLLTLADLNAAFKKGIFDQQQYRDYLPRLGYVEPEITILVELHAGG